MGNYFYKKKGIAIEKISAELYLLELNDRMPIMTKLQNKYDLSRGTVQNALTFLKEKKAIGTKSRGHLGTFIQQIDYKKLQYFANVEQLMGTMPLPYSKSYEGLATGLYLLLKEEDIKLNLAYIRGSKERIEATEKGQYDFAVVSKFAAVQEIRKRRDMSIILSFGQGTYLSKHVLIFSSQKKDTIEDGMKIGIDADSLDHYFMTKELVKDRQVTFVDSPANQLIYAVREKEIDAGIWNYDEVIEKGLTDLHYVDIPMKGYHRETSEAVIICRNDHLMIHSILKKNIEKQRMKEIQQAVKSGELTPRF